MPRNNNRPKKKQTKSKKALKPTRKKCIFTEQKIEYIDFKDVEVLRKFISSFNGKILPRRVTGVSAKYQRQLSTAIKLAREAALLPFIAN